MISKLPRWVEYGAFVLAFVAGTVNAVGFLGVKHQAISHLSGTVTLVGTGIITSNGNDVFHLAGILLSFLAGASLSGALLPGTSLKLGRHYDSLLAIEGIMLLVSIYLLKNSSLLGHYTASAACGIQNALATSYSGAIVRTTHMTGIFTDLGLMIGAKIRGDQFDRRKAILLLLIIIGFIAGGSLGAYLYAWMQFFALAVPAAICIVLATLYRVYAVKEPYGVS
ncbi:YoaK family protein [Leucothrix mucor]|uniref:YoaK family protein n=1 Tax=Leucothrix mucor TaxID=45248 RepID=UPI0003B49E20|nr:YoaK family protein [Leucothrix mucor]